VSAEPASNARPPRLRLALARHRLTSGDFRRVYARGRRAKGQAFTAVVDANGLAQTRLGLSVAKRSWKRAVDRNRVRRLLREAFRLELAALPPGLDVVLVAHAGPRAPRLVELRAELVRLVTRAAAQLARAASTEERMS
jgi:ribonuclease P protein component